MSAIQSRPSVASAAVASAAAVACSRDVRQRGREVEDRQRREDEQQHRRQRLLRPQLEQQVLARERGDVARSSVTSNASRSVARCSTRSGSWVATTTARSRELLERAVEQLGAVGVERVERLVEQEQRRVVQQHAAEREPLLHPARERRDALVAHVPEAEALEQHPDPLAALGHAVEPAEEVRGSRAASARGRRAARARGSRPRRAPAARARPPSAPRARRARAAASSCPAPFGPVTSRKSPRASVEVDAVEDALHAEALREVAGADHGRRVGRCRR